MIDELAGLTLWGFFRNDCVYESAAALVTVHTTKASAWRAMHRAKWNLFEDARSPSDTGLHMDRSTRRWWQQRRPLEDQAFYVAPIEVRL